MSLLQKNLLLALIYSGVGVVFLNIVRPGFAMPLFPPAGIALAALILFGVRLWPGVLLGILSLEIVEILQLGVPPGWWGLLGVVPVEFGEILFGYWLTHRLTGFRVRHMLRFTLLITPLCCLCSAVPAMWVLRAAGLVAPDALWSSGLIWWLGDVLGILLVAPIMFVFFGRPRDYWRPLRVSVALPISVALVLLIVIFMYVLGEEQSQIKARFEHDSQQMTATLNRHLANEEEMLLALGRLMRLQPDLSDQDWQDVVQSWMARHPGAQNFAWAPYVRHDERAAFEARMRRAGYANFVIRDANGKPAPKAEAYLPYIHLTPPPAKEEGDLLGQDISAWLSARRAWEDGSPHAMEGERLPNRSQERDTEVVLYHLVQAEEGGRNKWQGLVAGTLDANALLASALPKGAEGLEACIVEENNDASRYLAGAKDCEKPEWRRGHFFLSYPLAFVDRKGKLYTRASYALRLNRWGWNVWVSMTACALMVALLTIFLLTHSDNLQRSHAQTRRRLAQLRAFNKNLQEQTEVLLWPQRAFQMGSWEMRADGRFIASDELCVLLGFAPGELKSWPDLLARVQPEDREKLQKALEKARTGSGAGKISLDCRRLSENAEKPEEARVLSFFISNVEADDEAQNENVAAHQQGIVQDVTTRRFSALDTPIQHDDRVFLEDSMLENALRQGLERGELLLHYQPLVSSADGRVVGCEALVRWRHPEMGLLLPARFMHTANDSGLILPLGEWVFAEACRQQACWAARKLTVAINVSVLQFCHDDFLGSLTRSLEQTGADPRYLELEITGSTLMLPGEILLERCESLRNLGCGLVLDDFGVGYANMAHLRRLLLTRLKLDRSFVMGLPDDDDDRAITKATLAMATELGLEVSAKGVETTAQLKFLKEQGYPTLQGFLFGKPMEAMQFETWLGKRQGRVVDR
jgi:EAL domain-containing protein (putative c-di-GMP-specific phosphodiesterase class I)/CHASE1-domain containing sensor protein